MKKGVGGKMTKQFRESRPSKLKKIIQKELNETPLEVFGVGASFLAGLGLGALGKHTERWEIYGVLPAMNFMTVGFPRNTCDLAYIIGVVANYLPEIVQMYSI